MSLDPSLDLQEAIVQTLRSDPDMNSLVAGRVYDSVKASTTFPYVSVGPDVVTQDDSSCFEAYDIAVQIDVWSRAKGQPEMKRIAGAVRAALHNAELALDDFALVSLQHEITRYLMDPDGSTNHGVVSLRALIDGDSVQP